MAEHELKAGSPIAPFKWDDHPAFVSALQACFDGRADENQQTLAIKGIVELLCDYYNVPFFPGRSDEMWFAEGKRFIGAQIVKLTKLNRSNILRSK